ncbi:IS66 family transposase, partial [Faecalibaculum rodentium]
MALEYTEEKLNSLDKETIIQLFLSQQEQLRQIDHNLQLVLEQMADLKRHRFGRSSERHEPDEQQISFMEVDGKVVFFNEPEAVVAEGSGDEDPEAVPRRKPKKKQGKREEDLDGVPVVVVEHSMTEEDLETLFGKEGFKQLPDEVYRRYSFTPAKIEVEEHHVKVYAGKKTDEIVKAPHPESLLRGSLVSPSLEAAVINAKYVNAVPLYRQEQEFERYGLHISRQNMANWTIQCADRYLAVL